MTKLCRKCKKPIPSRALVDGAVKILSSRKFCLSCSPWGKHNTSRYPTEDKPSVVKRKCKHHGLTNFHLRKDGGYRCRKCRCEVVANNRRQKKKELVVLFGEKCEICGYDKCYQALEFHHIVRKDKTFGISQKNASLKTLFQEAVKCIMVCANCHVEIENGLSTIDFSLLEKAQTRKMVSVV